MRMVDTFAVGYPATLSNGGLAGGSSKKVCRIYAIVIALQVLSCGANTSAKEFFRNNSEKPAEVQKRVIGGFDAIPERFPYGQVSLLLRPNNHQCGGTVVAPDVVMTAAHCAQFFDTVRIGAYSRRKQDDANTRIQLFYPAESIVHPNFDPKMFRFDIMLVKLDGSVEDIDPIRLNADPRIPFLHKDLTLIGWGSTNFSSSSRNNKEAFPDVLQQANIPYVPNEMCENTSYNGRKPYEGEIFSEMLCAGEAGIDACRGDSGSPLIQEEWVLDGKDIQVGLVSWGRGCGKYPGVYTRVSRVFPWVRRQICWISSDPPAYLTCQDFERQHSTAPSFGPVLVGKSQAGSAEQFQDNLSPNAVDKDFGPLVEALPNGAMTPDESTGSDSSSHHDWKNAIMLNLVLLAFSIVDF